MSCGEACTQCLINAVTGQVASLTLALTPLSECYDKLGEEVWA
jgi:hypothetical protein